jgi:hypothetical protein
MPLDIAQWLGPVSFTLQNISKGTSPSLLTGRPER